MPFLLWRHLVESNYQEKEKKCKALLKFIIYTLIAIILYIRGKASLAEYSETRTISVKLPRTIGLSSTTQTAYAMKKQ